MLNSINASHSTVPTLTLVDSKGNISLLQSGNLTTVKIKAGEKYKLVKKAGEHEEALENVLVVKSGDNLEIIADNGSRLALDGFYGDTDTTLSITDANNGLHSLTSTTTADGLVYAQGDQSVLMGMSEGNTVLQTALIDRSIVSNLPHYAQAATGTATDAALGAGVAEAGGGIPTWAYVAGGIALAGGVAAAASGG